MNSTTNAFIMSSLLQPLVIEKTVTTAAGTAPTTTTTTTTNVPSYIYLNTPTYYNPRTTTQYASYNNNYLSTGFYKDLNKDKSVQKTYAKYYFYKIIDKWIYKELFPLLAFIDVKSGKPELIKSLEFFNVLELEKETEYDIEKKIKYMEEILITKNMVRHVLKKICDDNNINWYNLNKHEKKIKKVFYNYMLDKLKDAINKYGI
jgi:signal recognition particle GTPase